MAPLPIRLGIVLLTLYLVSAGAGCGSISPQPVPVPTEEKNSPTSVVALPKALEIPAIHVKSSLTQTGINKDRTLETPPVTQPEQASWYQESPRPGQLGPAIVLGHVDGSGRRGVFYKLHELRPGDLINITRQDGSTVVFLVYHVERASKKAFPTQRVYGNTQGSELRLITCGGAFDRSADSYVDNVIVYASLNEVKVKVKVN